MVTNIGIKNSVQRSNIGGKLQRLFPRIKKEKQSTATFTARSRRNHHDEQDFHSKSSSDNIFDFSFETKLGE
jgi:hypothetical protein